MAIKQSFSNNTGTVFCYSVIMFFISIISLSTIVFAETTVDDVSIKSNSFRLFFNTSFTFEKISVQNDGIVLQLTESSESRKYNFFRTNSPVSYDVSLDSISNSEVHFTVNSAGLTDKKLSVTGTELSAVKLDNALSNNWTYNAGVNTINVNSASTVSLFFSPLPTSTSSGGSGGGDRSKPVISNSVDDSNNFLDSRLVLEVNRPHTISFVVQENQGINNLEHVTVYFDTKKPDLSQDFKTTHIRWEKNKTPTLNNPSGFLNNADIRVVPVDAITSKIDIEFSFAVPMESVDLQFVVWDLSRNQIQQYYSDAIQVIPEKSILSEPEIDPEPIEKYEIEPEPLFSWNLFNEWAGYSTDSMSDKEFLLHLGIKDEKIPNWVKENNAKWLKNGYISQQDFLIAITNLHERHLLS